MGSVRDEGAWKIDLKFLFIRIESLSVPEHFNLKSQLKNLSQNRMKIMDRANHFHYVKTWSQ